MLIVPIIYAQIGGKCQKYTGTCQQFTILQDFSIKMKIKDMSKCGINYAAMKMIVSIKSIFRKYV